MSIEIIKTGLNDTFQDKGRYGFQHLGINPSGAMDQLARQLVNAFVGNDGDEAVIEMCFPAATLRFKESALIALSGADFMASCASTILPVNRTILIPAGAVLSFKQIKQGRFCYLAVQGGFAFSPWLGSKSTNTKIEAESWNGRRLKKGDIIAFNKTQIKSSLVNIFHWYSVVKHEHLYPVKIRCFRGSEFDWLEKKEQRSFEKQQFTISHESDRMGYRLIGKAIRQSKKVSMISTGVVAGTIQLLPTGQLIVLMADHQTTGGYPRIATIVAVDNRILAQHPSSDPLSFQLVTLEEAEQASTIQHAWLRKVKFSIQEKLKQHDLIIP